jgi:AraC-like DNA-binding protein
MPLPASVVSTRCLVGAGHVLPDPKWRMSAHAHAFHEIIAPVRGTLHVKINGEQVAGTAGDLLIYQAGNAHEEISAPDDPVETYYMAFEHPAFCAPLPVKIRDSRSRAGLMISWLSAEPHPSTEFESAAALGLLDSVVAEVVRLAREPEPGSLVSRTRAYARTRMAKNISLDDLARHAGMSRFHFLRRFQAAAGRTPMRDLCLLRLDHVRNLILTTDLPLKAIAPLAGLGDEYHLSRLFRKYFGCPPGSLRKGQRKHG